MVLPSLVVVPPTYKQANELPVMTNSETDQKVELHAGDYFMVG